MARDKMTRRVLHYDADASLRPAAAGRNRRFRCLYLKKRIPVAKCYSRNSTSFLNWTIHRESVRSTGCYSVPAFESRRMLEQ